MSVLIAIDAGHGINTSGRRCSKEFDPQQHREWWLNDRVARFLQERAAQYEGFNVLRVDDVTGQTDVALAERCRRANAAKADFFLSIHHNGGINGGSGGGLVAYCCRGSAEGIKWRDALYDAVLAAGGLRGNRAEPKLEKNYDVIYYANAYAVLIEHGFMDSSVDVPIIITDAYAKACGYAEADCIAAKFGLKRKTTDPLADASNWAKAACQRAIDKGIFSGDGSGHYMWKEPVTREQLAVILDKITQ